jgi:glycyl-tRNA synthetase beta subunit
MGIITLLDRYFPYLVWRDVAMKAASQAVEFFGKGDIEEVYKYMTDVVAGRFRGYFDDVSYEALAAARDGWETRPFGSIHTIARVLDSILNEDKTKLEKVAFGHKRIRNILKGEEDLDTDIAPDGEWEERLYTKAIEVSDALGSLNFYKSDDVQKAISILMDLAEVLDKFFEEVLVNHEDEVIRKRRKSLLKLTGDVFERVARFDKLGL